MLLRNVSGIDVSLSSVFASPVSCRADASLASLLSGTPNCGAHAGRSRLSGLLSFPRPAVPGRKSIPLRGLGALRGCDSSQEPGASA